MFDDNQPKNQPAGVPGNLPIGEPDDMFSGVEPVAPPLPAEPAAPTTSVAPNSALGAGVLKPKQPVSAPIANSTMPPMAPTSMQNGGMPPATAYAHQTTESGAPSQVSTMPRVGGVEPPMVPGMQTQQGEYTIKDPSMSRGIMTIIILIIVLIILGGGGWFVYSKFIKAPAQAPFGSQLPLQDTSTDVFGEGSVTTGQDTALENELGDTVGDVNLNLGNPDTGVSAGAGAIAPTNEVSNELIDETLLFGETSDADNDGLDELREAEQGTDSNHWDTDGDGLSDGEEVIIWGTNPLNSDTDADSFEDGEEVKAGYNPKGPGKLFEVPATAPSEDLGTSNF